MLEYARHCHFFEDPSITKDSQYESNNKKKTGWLFDTSDFCSIPGRGVQCDINSKQIPSLLAEKGVTVPTDVEIFLVDLEENAETGILVAYDFELIGVVGVADPLRREAAIVMEGLFKMGVRSIMVTGDNWRTAKAVAKEGVSIGGGIGRIGDILDASQLICEKVQDTGCCTNAQALGAAHLKGTDHTRKWSLKTSAK